MTEQATEGSAPAQLQRLAQMRGLLVGGWRIERRTPTSTIWYRVGAIVLGVALSALALQLAIGTEENVFGKIFRETFGSQRGFENVLTQATPLILTSLAVAVAYRMRQWNIGGEGQFFMGAWGATAVAFALPDLGGGILLTLMLAAAAATGAAWILLPALARAYAGVSEILTTLMLNFVALFWLPYWTTRAWRDPVSQGSILNSRPLPGQADLPALQIGSTEFSSGLIIGIAAALLLWLTFRWTPFGYMVTMAGASEKAGTYAGIHIRRLLVVVMLLSGALAGLAGATEMTGNVHLEVHRFSNALSNNTGYMGIAVAVLAGGSFLGVIMMAIVLAAIATSGNALRLAGISSEFSTFGMAGLVLLVAALGEAAARFRIVRVVKEKEASPTGEEPQPTRAPAEHPLRGTGDTDGS